MAIGLNLYLGSQSICFVGFWVSYYGWSYARQTQIYFYFLAPFSLPNGITPLLSLSIYCLFLVLFSELPTPFSSFSSLIYSSRLVEELWLLQVISGIGGLIPLFQSGCLGGSGRSGIGIASHLRRFARRRYSPRQCRAAEMQYPQAVTLLYGI